MPDRIRASHGGRTAVVGGLLLRSLARKARFRLRGLLAGRARRDRLVAEYHLATATEAAAVLGEMKGVWMKLGQILSFAASALPEEAQAALAVLQQGAPPMAFPLVRGVLEEDLGDLARHFRDLDEEPIAAASIGQVHRGRLRDGTMVAVKVQYPGIADAIATDLEAGETLAAVITAVNRNLDAPAVVAELRERLADELDYRRELANQALFARLWAGHPLVRIPRVFPEHSARRVLCQALHVGLSFEDFLAVGRPAERRTAVAVLMDFVWDSMLRFAVLNGDPHPGNYLFHEDGGVSFLDFGCIKRFQPALLDDVLALWRALTEEDRDAFRRAAERLRIVLPGRTFDGAALWEFFAYQAAPYLRDEEFTIDRAWVESATRAMGPAKFRINLPPDLLFFNRITFGLNAILARLGARANFHRMYLRYLRPEQDLPPAVADLGVELPARFRTSQRMAAGDGPQPE